MAKKQKDQQPPKGAEDEAPIEEPTSPEESPETDDALALARASEDAAEEGAEGGASGEEGEGAPDAELAEGGLEEEEEQAAGQLGSERYVLAGFFATGMLAAYVLGRTFNGIWSTAANKEWFAQALPSLAAVPDDSKGTYSTVLAALISIVVVYRVYKRPDIRAWSDEVAAELNKVKWPSKKEVASSTTVVIVASLLATAYLTVLDRLYAFVTNIVYGNGS
jgi:preprotein translocase subunit SecE